MTSGGDKARLRLAAYSLGLLRNKPLKRALASMEIDLLPGPINRDLDAVVAWGNSQTSQRALAASRRRDLPIVYLEDAFLRSVTPDEFDLLIGLTIDHQAPYFDASRPTDLEDLLNAASPSEGPNLAFDEYRDSRLSKYNFAVASPPDQPFVLVVDQLPKDASIEMGQATRQDFALSLEAAIDENPGLPVFIKSHPKSSAGHFDYGKLPSGVARLPDDCDPILSVQRAEGVYCVTSQLGFEAILHGKAPRVFGLPFYAGWGLSSDEKMTTRRSNVLTREMLFRVVLQDYCRWFDPLSGEPTEFVDALRGLHARRRLHELRRRIGVVVGFTRWKRPWLRRLLPGVEFSSFDNAAKRAAARNVDCAVWASKSSDKLITDCQKHRVRLWHVEDGFVRSKGLGAELTPPGSLVFDDLGMYFDPRKPSRLERDLQTCSNLSAFAADRALALQKRLIEGGFSKYNLPKTGSYQLPKNKIRILVPGQVEDDASVLFGGGSIKTNLDLLRETRKANPDAYIVYKPHPDVVATLRAGSLSEVDVTEFCDCIVAEGDPIPLIESVDEIWTITSLLGFEALLRGKTVVCFGRPFYGGWSLTRDIERHAFGRVKIDGVLPLLHAALVEYPIYFCSISGSALSVEQHLDRIADRGADAWEKHMGWALPLWRGWKLTCAPKPPAL